METFEKLPLAKRVFFEYVVSKETVTQEDFDELRKVSSRAFQYGKANTNARYREFVLSENNVLCCDYCGKQNLSHNPIKTKGTKEEYVTNIKDFFYGQNKVVDPATVDHINPISLGADVTNFENLTISCEDCNSLKGSMTFSEWVGFMHSNKKYQYYFKEHNHKDKYQKALMFKPHMDHLISFNGEVKINREDLSPYLRYKLGHKYDTKWQRIISTNKSNIPYYGSVDKPIFLKNLWINTEGIHININEIKLIKVRKILSVLEDDDLIKLFLEIHDINLSNEKIELWKRKLEQLIKKKSPNKKKTIRTQQNTKISK